MTVSGRIRARKPPQGIAPRHLTGSSSVPKALGHNQVSPSWVPGSGVAVVLEGLVRIWVLRKQVVSVPPTRIVKMGRTDAIRP